MEELKNKLEQLYKRVEGLKDQINTEEATKNAFIMPFLQILGYDIFNPTEVIPEFVADIGTKKGEKVDYVIMKDGEPIVIIECKHWKEKTDAYNWQLQRYFQVTNVRFAIMTNGIIYDFFTDSERPNVMDKTPFLSLNLENLQGEELEKLSLFANNDFNTSRLLKTAQVLRYKEGIRTNLKKEIENPSYDFVKVLSKGVFLGHPKGYEWDEFNSLAKEVIQEEFNRKEQI